MSVTSSKTRVTAAGRRALRSWAKAQKAGRDGRLKTNPGTSARLAWYVAFTEFRELDAESDVWARIQAGIDREGNSCRWLARQIARCQVTRWLCAIEAVSWRIP